MHYGNRTKLDKRWRDSVQSQRRGIADIVISKVSLEKTAQASVLGPLHDERSLYFDQKPFNYIAPDRNII